MWSENVSIAPLRLDAEPTYASAAGRVVCRSGGAPRLMIPTTDSQPLAFDADAHHEAVADAPARQHVGTWPVVVTIVLAGVLFFFVTTNHFAFTRDGPDAQGRFYEGQATAILHGHLDVPRSAIGDEAIVVGGRDYGYYGIAPALLRVPVMAFMDGSPYLAPWYYLLAFTLEAVALVGIARSLGLAILWQCIFVAVVLVGSMNLSLAQRTFVYEEAILWGVTFSLLAVWALLEVLDDGSGWWGGMAALSAGLAILSRPTVGAGAVAGVAAVGLVRRSWPLAAGAATAVAAYVCVNEAKFGTALGPPFARALNFRADPVRLALVRVGPIDPRYLLTNLLQYLRPDTVVLGGRFPWVAYRMPALHAVTLVGIGRLDNVDPVSSLTVTAPALVLLTVVGVVVAGRDRRVLLAALAFGPLLTCMSFDEAQRFLGDFVPLLALGGAIGLAWAIRGCRWLLAPLAALVLFSAWVCFGLAWP
jgi:hypothetical protein